MVQSSLIELVRSIDRFRGDCSLDFWVSTVGAHVVYKHIRRRRFERGVFEPGDVDGATATAVDTAGRSAVARDLLRRVRRHLDAMDPDKAWAFLLHDVCGFDLRECARILEVSVAAAQKRLVRGRRDIRDRVASDAELRDLLAKTPSEES